MFNIIPLGQKLVFMISRSHNRRLRLYLILLPFLLGALWYIVQPRWQALRSEVVIQRLFAKNFERNVKLLEVDTRSVVYNSMFSKVHMERFLEKATLHERCKLYFDELRAIDPNWKIDPGHKMPYQTDAFESFAELRRQHIRRLGQSYEKSKGKAFLSELPSDRKIRQDLASLRQTVVKDEQSMHDYVSHVRIFDRCFLSPSDLSDLHEGVRKEATLSSKDVSEPSEANDSQSKFVRIQHCKEVESRVFYWLTLVYPIFTRWDGKVNPFPAETASLPTKNECFFKDYKASLSGRGIVMTLSDAHVLEIVVLITALSTESTEALVRAARNEFMGYVEQDLWFVDVSMSIKMKYQTNFKGFFSKIMATMFNSFEEMLIFDADIALLVNPSFFFETQKFVSKGAFFFKDRGFVRLREDHDAVFFKKLFPSAEDSVMFGMAQPTDFTLKNEFFEGFLHYVESGVVAMNRKKHFLQPLMMATLSFYAPVNRRLYGDKELFWLSLAVLGDESYATNDHFAAAIGEFTPQSERLPRDSIPPDSKEICSSHPGHISDTDDQTLLWFNSGFRHCGNSQKPGFQWEKEVNDKSRYTSLKTMDEFQSVFRGPLKITHAIIPPNPSMNSFQRDYRNLPIGPWQTLLDCQFYLWCGASQLEVKDTKSEYPEEKVATGLVVNFPPEQIARFDAAAKVWIADL